MIRFRLLLLPGLCLAACSAEPAATPATADIQAGATTDGGQVGDATDAEATADVATGPAKLLARVFANDPITDEKKLTEVELTAPTSDDGSLAGAYVEVRNCLNEEGGEPIKQGGFEIGTFCNERRLVQPGPDGTYLHVAPPADYGDQADAFAELQMYHHVNRMHDYFKTEHGLADLDHPLQALVNVQFYVNETVAGFLGLKPGWQGFPNAAFVPEEGFAAFSLPPRQNGAIVFGQYESTDFCYDASVIYHEYTHALVGTTRLNGVLPDSFGLDNLPGAMNEGFADYFACSLTDRPVIGTYALAFAGPHMVRDLSKKRRCPDDLTTEIHADGRIIGSCLWALREALGRPAADTIILNALQGFSKATSMNGAATLILAEAKKVDEALAPQVKAILEDHGMLGCQRVKPWVPFQAAQSADQLPYSLAGTQALQGMQLEDGVPGYVQFVVDVPKGAQGVTLSWTAKAEGFGGFGGGGGGYPLELALRKGKNPEFIAFSGTVLADHKVKASADPAKQGGQKVTLTGACLPAGGGKLFAMFLNKNQAQGAIQQMDVQILQDVGGAVNVEACP